MGCFIRLTHERYARALAPWLGSTVTAVFCDEPDPLGRNVSPQCRPWTPGLEKELGEVGLTLCDLPRLWLGEDARAREVRRRYDQLIARHLGRSFYQPLRDWCHAHGLQLTGHPQHADDIGLERYFDIPGQDLVWRWVAPEDDLSLRGRESTQAACAFSAMLHQGARQNSSECFGCCGPKGDQWAMNVDDLLFFINWLAVRGCCRFYPHAFLYAGDTPVRLNDRPPDVGPRNYWWPWFGQLAGCMSRLSAMLTDAVADVPVAILCDDTHLPYETAACLQRLHVPYCYLTAEQLAGAWIEENGDLLLPHGVRHSHVIIEDGQLEELPDVAQALSRLPRVYRAWRTGPERTARQVARDVPLPFTLEGGEDIRLLYRRHGSEWLLMLCNEGEGSWQGVVRVARPGRCVRLDPFTGETADQPLTPEGLPVSLEFRQLLCFVLDEAQAPKTVAALPRQMT